MARKIERQDITNYSIDSDTACVCIKDENFILDYETLMDVLVDLAKMASQMERHERTNPLDIAVYQ